MSKPRPLLIGVKWGLLLALERDIENNLEFVKKRPKGWLESDDANDWRGDARNLLNAADWLLEQKPPHYINMGTLRRDLELLRGMVL